MFTAGQPLVYPLYHDGREGVAYAMSGRARLGGGSLRAGHCRPHMRVAWVAKSCAGGFRLQFADHTECHDAVC